MKKKLEMVLVALAALAMVGCGKSENATSSSKANANEGVYVKEVHYTDDNVGEIPQDAINQVMFAYSEKVDVTFETTLTLDEDNHTYTLYKLIDPAESTDENGETIKSFKGEWEYTGTYEEVSDNEVLLHAPDTGKNNIYYPTALNYGSLEKQTQDWETSEENPEVLKRFNKWYPVVNDEITDQTVTISTDGTLEYND